MSIRHRTGLSVAIALTITLAGCDSALITGTSAPSIGAALVQPLLSDGDFELGATDWESCSANGSSELANDASAGDLALQLQSGACRYQNTNAETGRSYQLNCDAKRNADGWSSVTMAFLDLNYRPLVSHEIPVESDTYTTANVTMTAPDFTSRVEVLFYSDGDMTVDSCNLTEVMLDVPVVTMQNGSFNEGLEGWSQCAGVSASATNGIASVANGACIHQTQDIGNAVMASAANEPLTVSFQCDQITKVGNQYAAAIVAFLDENNQPVAKNEQPIVAGTTSTAVTLAAPETAHLLEMMIYSEGQTSIGQCNVATL